MFAGATAMASLATSAATQVDASHSLECYLTPLTPGATVISASGTNYLPPGEPAPGTEYRFTGFYAPVQNPPVVNVLKAGTAVPIKVRFSVGGYHGNDVLASGYPASQRVACGSGADSDRVTETASPGLAGLSYDAVSDQYTHVWKTDGAWRGTCRAFILKLNSGETHTATFLLKK